MKLPAGPFVAWAALYGVLSASAVSADSLALKLSRDIDVIAPKPVAVGTLGDAGRRQAGTSAARR